MTLTRRSRLETRQMTDAERAGAPRANPLASPPSRVADAASLAVTQPLPVVSDLA